MQALKLQSIENVVIISMCFSSDKGTILEAAGDRHDGKTNDLFCGSC